MPTLLPAKPNSQGYKNSQERQQKQKRLTDLRDQHEIGTTRAEKLFNRQFATFVGSQHQGCLPMLLLPLINNRKPFNHLMLTHTTTNLHNLRSSSQWYCHLIVTTKRYRLQISRQSSTQFVHPASLTESTPSAQQKWILNTRTHRIGRSGICLALN
jgi:hypothetical protein